MKPKPTGGFCGFGMNAWIFNAAIFNHNLSVGVFPINEQSCFLIAFNYKHKNKTQV